MPHLFEPLPLRGLTLANRILVSPMCQYSSVDGFSNDWHFVHLGSRAAGGPALVFTEASAVTPDGRISPRDLGMYRDDHVESLARIVDVIHAQGTLAGMQLAHAGRKGSTAPPWEGGRVVLPSAGGWQPVGPTAEPFAAGYPVPRQLTVEDLAAIVDAFRQAAVRARAAGFDVIEVHAAHGYLIHEFLSPLVNTRTDEYGGSYDNRVRLCLEIVRAVRAVWPEQLPIFVRLSCTDWKPGGWDVEQSVELARPVSTWSTARPAAPFLTPSFPWRLAFRSDLRSASAARRAWRREPSASSRNPGRRTASSETAGPTAYSWRASCCAIRTGRCARRASSNTWCRGPCSTSAPLRQERPPG
jgi:2,4-dienoyl-CoA reductase-like NADH-dependent reductase (Old Yellow Enzyme family)